MGNPAPVVRRSVFLVAALVGALHAQPGSLTLVQMCDPQLGFGGYAHDTNTFRQAVDQVNARRPDLAVICGDLVDSLTTNAVGDFRRLRGRLTMPCLCAPGNHDVGNAPDAASLQNYRVLFGPDYFAYRTNGWTFLVVNTSLWRVDLPGETERQDAWLQSELARARSDASPVIVVGHYPPFVDSLDEKDSYYNLPVARRRALWTLFRANGVVAVLCGHTHRTVDRTVDGIRVVCGEVTSRAFDGQPPGFRLWTLASATNITATPVPIALPPPSPAT